MEAEDFIYGTRAVMEAIQNGKNIDKVLIKTGLKNELVHELINLMKEKEIAFQFVPIEKINRVTRKNHQGCWLLLLPLNIPTLKMFSQWFMKKAENL